jgi:phytoene dehydrogenase-like protein
MVNVPPNKGQDWDKLIAQARAAILAKLSRLLGTEIEKLIETENILDPLSIEKRTSSYRGALYGSSSNSRLSAFFRHPNFKGSIDQLYFCGGSVHPGGGIPLCLRSAEIVSKLVS